MRATFIALGLLTFTSCPERTTPERGIALVYGKPADSADLRAVVDRRLAQLKLKALLQEDSTTLTVRVPEGVNVERIKKALSRTAKLEFCEEAVPTARAWCAVSDSEARIDRAGDACALQADTRVRLEQLINAGDAGVPIAWSATESDVTAYALGACQAPRVVSTGIAAGDFPGVWLDFDRPSGRSFGELTAKLVGRRLLIRLDGAVTSAPVVKEPITGGRAMLSVGTDDVDDLEVLAASLAGGALPTLELKREGPYGPPSLR